MATIRWVPVCQWCGQRGTVTGTSSEYPPNITARVSGKCKSHPSGKPNMEHGPRWERC